MEIITSAYNKAHESFLRHKNELNTYKQNLSETDTRCKYIDWFFKDILGWTEELIEREKYVQPGFIDYEFSTPQFRFVVEAKRVLYDLKLPEKTRNCKIKSIYKENKEVIDQIREYILKRNLSYGIITNGKKFIIAKFVNTDGANWLDNESIIFNGLVQIEHSFSDFYNLLSVESVRHNGRIRFSKNELIGKKIIDSKHFKRKADEVLKNEFSDVLVSIIGQIFAEISETTDLNDFEKLKACYVKNEDVKASSSKLGILFKDEPPRFDSRILPVKNTTNTQTQLKAELTKDIRYTPDPVVIIGSKGAGKTTFIRNFIEVELDREVKQSRPIIYIDFRGYTRNQINDVKGIYNQIFEQLKERYSALKLSELSVLKTIYSSEIKENEKGIWSLFSDISKKNDALADFLTRKIEDIEGHLKKISLYLLKFQSKRLTIIFDNVDQLDDDSQRSLFLLAHSFKRSLNALSIISLREGYFYVWKNRPPFDAFQSNVFHITAPPYRDVLKGRLDYVIANFNFDSVSATHKNKLLSVSHKSLLTFFRNLSETLFSGTNSEIIEFLEETTFPNIREGLDTFNCFLISGHTQIASYFSTDSYRIPIWEFVKSIALESQYYYRSDFSRVKNLLNPTPENKNHFTKIRLLIYFKLQAELNSVHDPYCLVFDLVDLFVKTGYTKEIIQSELKELLQFKLIETKGNFSDIDKLESIEEEEEMRITQAGYYYYTKLIPTFHYHDLILQDTPIFDDFYYERIKSSFPEADLNGERSIRDRLITVQTFIEYLRKMEVNDHRTNEFNKGHKAFDTNIVDHILENGLTIDIKRIENALSKQNFQ